MASAERRVLVMMLTVTSVMVLLSSAALPTSGEVPEDPFSGVTTIIVPFSQNPMVEVDGTIGSGEYDTSLSYKTTDTGISVSTIHDDDALFVALSGPSWSWVAIGISSDNATTMGFVVVARSGSGYAAQERLSTQVAEDMTFSNPPIPGSHGIEEFEATTAGANSVAEMKLSLESSVWSLIPGVVYPSVVATNLTAPSGFPAGISGEGVHFVGSYLLRPGDDVKAMNDLLNGKISPVPSIVAAAVLSIGIVLIFTEFVVRRRRP